MTSINPYFAHAIGRLVNLEQDIIIRMNKV